jgi:hypothetical protein
MSISDDMVAHTRSDPVNRVTHMGTRVNDILFGSAL